MKHCVIFLLSLILANFAFSQNTKIGEWAMHLNYTNINVITSANNAIYVGTKSGLFSFSNNEKKARSETTFEFFDTAIKPINPIKNTIGIIITNDEIKLYFNTLLSFAAYILCQFP